MNASPILFDLNNMVGDLVKLGGGGTKIFDMMASQGVRFILTDSVLEELENNRAGSARLLERWIRDNNDKIISFMDEVTIEDYRRYADALDGGPQGKVRNAIKAFDSALDEAVEQAIKMA